MQVLKTKIARMSESGLAHGVDLLWEAEKGSLESWRCQRVLIWPHIHEKGVDGEGIWLGTTHKRAKSCHTFYESNVEAHIGQECCARCCLT